ncbi:MULTISPECIES: tetratricopeptide repeat protein [unclassified Thioalkalivibrio]|uniref:tetratricopeptide repeat protein n=1 Tax=unclassified Thioalkalivibrio TaxID=2621013 RepID=UPI00037E4133|nr:MULTISPECIES: tetratricopeptide repeat protein [unclassified Thioalkalivibrio]
MIPNNSIRLSLLPRPRPVAALLAVLFLAACAVPETRGPAPEQPPGADAPEPEAIPHEESREPEPAAEPEATPSAALALAEQAEGSRSEGNLERAAQQLERALRIAPRDASLWHQMARIRLEQGNYPQADRLAGRSLQLGGERDRSLALENWRVIKAAREAMGDEEGAREAQEAIQRLETGVV